MYLAIGVGWVWDVRTQNQNPHLGTESITQHSNDDNSCAPSAVSTFHITTSIISSQRKQSSEVLPKATSSIKRENRNEVVVVVVNKQTRDRRTVHLTVRVLP